MRKQLIFLFLLIIPALAAVAQTPPPFGPQLPNLVPNSPDAAAITKGADLSSSFFTGAAQANIPLYEIKSGAFSMPIALSYGSNGLRVDELPSKVGMGWTLSCSGVVTRTMHDRPDEIGVRPTPIGTGLTNQQIRDYYYDLTTNGDIDSEPDEFFVSAPGLKTKFILDDSSRAIVIPYSKIKIDVSVVSGQIDKITVVNTNGAKYEFGRATGVSGQGYDVTTTDKENTRTAFYIKRITQTDGRTIDFWYEQNLVYYYAGVSQSIFRGSEQNLSMLCGCSTESNCPGPVADAANLVTNYGYSEQSMASLSTIITSDSQKVEFNYEVFDEASGDKRINWIKVTAGELVRKWELNYIKPTTITTGFSPGTQGIYADYNPRFFLSQVKIISMSDPEYTVGKFKLDYHEVDLLPKRLSYAQDFLGYFNGASNTTFLPAIPGQETYWGATADADRNFHGMYASRGLLEKITLPTGGSETFFYEPNTVAKLEPGGFETSTILVQGDGGVASGSPAPQYYESAAFTVLRSQNTSVQCGWIVNPDCTVSCQMPTSLQATMAAHIIDVSNNSETPIGFLAGSATTASSFAITLSPGTYKIKMTINRPVVRGTVSMIFDPNLVETPINEWVNHEAGGVRVKKIESFDQLTNSATTRYFTYANKKSLLKSSGNAVEPDPVDQGIDMRRCPSFEQGNGACPNPIINNACERFTLSSSSLSALYGNDGSRVMYAAVIEHNDPFFSQGGIEHIFDASVRTNVIDPGPNFPIKTIPANTISSTQGMELETNYFDAAFQTVKKSIFNYEEFDDSTLIRHYNARAIRLTYNSVSSTLLTSNPLGEFDITDYQHKANWIRLATQIDSLFQGAASLVTKQIVNYDGSGAHTQPIRSATINSKGDTIITETKYPTDFASTPVFSTMIGKNILDVPVQQMQKENSVQQTKTSTDFNDWFNNGSVLKPQRIKFKVGSFPEEDRIKFYGYDGSGNVLKLSKEGDVRLVYLWNYNHLYVVAEARNADTIAYTSFEGDDNGNWSGIPSAPIGRVQSSVTATSDLSVAVTGDYYYHGSGFIFTTTGKDDKPYYYVSYWTGNSGAYTVTNTESGWPKLLKTLTINGKTWKLYEHKVPGNLTITVSGSGDIDELRFIPEGAQMSTYTYKPFIGMSSQADINHTIMYYGYDEMGRLSHVRDEHKNIIRKLCYNYAGEPEKCGIQVFSNVERTGTFFKNNCPCGATASPFVYTVPAGTYVSSISQALADAQAQAEIDSNGQAQANAASAEVYCPSSGVYVRIETASSYHSGNYFYGTFKLRFYCDEACTTPISVTNLEVNHHRIKEWCNNNQLTNTFTTTCNGYETTIATDFIYIAEGTNLSCYAWDFVVDTGTGYTPINP